MGNGTFNVDTGFPSFWGDGSDGILSAGATFQEGVDFDKYSGFCIKQYSEIDWDPATPETLTVDEPCRGMILFVDGDVYIGSNAKISMAKLGSILQVNPSELIDLYGESTQMHRIVDVLKTLKGGAGGDGGDGQSHGDSTGGTGGTGGVGLICQGDHGAGGGGAVSDTGGSPRNGGDGGSIEWIGPGFGGGPNDAESPNAGYDGVNGAGGGSAVFLASTMTNSYATKGGDARGAGGGGGASAYNGNAINGQDGEHSGGFILIVAKGAVTIEGTIDVTGGNGGNGGSGSQDGGGGGGAGGGVIAIFSRTSVNTSSATIIKAGGAGGTGYQNGTGGQQGTFYSEAMTA